MADKCTAQARPTHRMTEILVETHSFRKHPQAHTYEYTHTHTPTHMYTHTHKINRKTYTCTRLYSHVRTYMSVHTCTGGAHEAPEGFHWIGRGDKTFLYDIVANKRNGVDVDRFDYFRR